MLSCSRARRSRRRRAVIVERYCQSGRLPASATIATAASTENHIGLVPAAGAASVCIVHRVCSRAQRSRRSRSIKMSRVLLGDEQRIITPVAARAPIAPSGTGCPRFAPRRVEPQSRSDVCVARTCSRTPRRPDHPPTSPRSAASRQLQRRPGVSKPTLDACALAQPVASRSVCLFRCCLGNEERHQTPSQHRARLTRATGC